MHENRFHKRVIFLIAYLLFAILPVSQRHRHAVGAFQLRR